MIKYVKITHYMAGASLEKQVNKMFDDGVMDEDTRVFFENSNCLTTKDVREMLHWFDVKTDDGFNKENIVFVPKEWILKRGYVGW